MNTEKMKIGIIGGSAFYSLHNLQVLQREMVTTPYGPPSSPVVFGSMNGGEDFIFIHRHGFGHTIAPHQINYRANIWALKKLDVTHVIAITAVGGITDQMTPGTIVFPHQIIDYTNSRDHTFYDDMSDSVVHVDFTNPYDEGLREVLISSVEDTGLSFVPRGVYGATQGPRLETAAEIERMERDGCDIVGMTGMPEASLAREQGLLYANCSVVVNDAAGKRGADIITMKEIKHNLDNGMRSVHTLLINALPRLGA